MPKEEVSVCVCVCVTIGRQPVRLSCLGVGSVDGRLLHTAELGLASVRWHGRCCWRGEDMRVRSGVGEETAGRDAAFRSLSHPIHACHTLTWRGREEGSTDGLNGGCIRCW